MTVAHARGQRVGTAIFKRAFLILASSLKILWTILNQTFVEAKLIARFSAELEEDARTLCSSKATARDAAAEPG